MPTFVEKTNPYSRCRKQAQDHRRIHWAGELKDRDRERRSDAKSQWLD